MKRTDLILETIQNNPGIHVRGLIGKTNLENGVIIHYLDKLEKEGKIKSKKHTRYKRYYSLYIDEEEFDIINNLRKPTKKKIIFAIIIHGNPTFREIVSKIDKSPSTISWNLSGLERRDIIERTKKEGKTCYKIKNTEILKHTFKKEFSKLLHNEAEHSEDIFLAL